MLHSLSNYLSELTQSQAERFHKKYQLRVERDVFVRGVFALRSQSDITNEFSIIQASYPRHPNEPQIPIELRVGKHRYTRLESEILYKAFLPEGKWEGKWQGKWETLKNLSRLHRLLIVACIFAAMTQ